ncbi:MAG: helix-turn-helix domain-containing protein [Bacteroidota bacterium]
MENEIGLSRDAAFLKKLTEAVRQNLENENFGVAELSDAVAISRFQLHRKLKQLKGQSVSQFIRDIRLQEARKMLAADVGTVAEIAYRVGFSSPSYFSKCFHDHFGFPPNESRKYASASAQEVGAVAPPLTAPLDISSNRKKRVFMLAGAVVLAAAMTFVVFYAFRPAPPRQVALAVLPLENLTGSDEQTYFVSGIHDALIGQLGRISGLRVISRTSTLRYPSRDMLLQDIARELGVDAIVEGSVYGTGDSVRIQLQLIEVFPRERHVWAKEYHEDVRRALTLQSSVVQDIAREIQVSLTAEEARNVMKTREVDSELYRDYLRGMYHINQFSLAEVEKGIAILQNAIDIDPADPLPWAGLAIGYSVIGHSPSTIDQAYSRAKSAAHKAISLDESLPEAHLALALVALYDEWEWEVADREFQRAIELNPSLAVAHTHYAWYHMLFGQLDKMWMHSKLAVQLDPFLSLYSGYLASQYWYTGANDLALAEVARVMDFEPDADFALFVQGSAYLAKGMIGEGVAAHEKAAQLYPRWRWLLPTTYAIAGRQNDAIQIAEEMKKNAGGNDAWGLAEAYSALGDLDQAFYWLERAYEKRMSWIPWMAWNPNFKPLQQDVRFSEMMEKLKLPYGMQAMNTQAVSP